MCESLWVGVVVGADDPAKEVVILTGSRDQNFSRLQKVFQDGSGEGVGVSMPKDFIPWNGGCWACDGRGWRAWDGIRM